MLFQIGDRVITPRHRIAKIVSGSSVNGFWLEYEDDGDMVTMMPAHLKIYEIGASQSKNIGGTAESPSRRAKGHRRHSAWRSPPAQEVA